MKTSRKIKKISFFNLSIDANSNLFINIPTSDHIRNQTNPKHSKVDIRSCLTSE